MAEEVVNMTDFRKEQIRREKEEARRRKLEAAGAWIDNHQELALVIIPAGITGLGFLIKTICKHVNLNKQKSIKEMYCYDRSLGHYWKLRRELSNTEWVEIEKRKKNGERLADILESLKVLA